MNSKFQLFLAPLVLFSESLFALTPACQIRDLQAMLGLTPNTANPLAKNLNGLKINYTQISEEVERLIGRNLGSLTRPKEQPNFKTLNLLGYYNHVLAIREIWEWSQKSGVDIGCGTEHGKANPDFRLGPLAMEYKSHSPAQRFYLDVDDRGDVWFLNTHASFFGAGGKLSDAEVVELVSRTIQEKLLKDLEIASRQLLNRTEINVRRAIKKQLGGDPYEAIYALKESKENLGILWTDINLTPYEIRLSREDLIAIVDETLRGLIASIDSTYKLDIRGIGGFAVRLHLSGGSEQKIPTWLYAVKKGAVFSNSPEDVYPAFGPVLDFFTDNGGTILGTSLKSLFPGPKNPLSLQIMSRFSKDHEVREIDVNLGRYISAFQIKDSFTGKTLRTFHLNLNANPSKSTFEKERRFQVYVQKILDFIESQKNISEGPIYFTIEFKSPQGDPKLVEIYPELIPYLDQTLLGIANYDKRGWAILYNEKLVAESQVQSDQDPQIQAITNYLRDLR